MSMPSQPQDSASSHATASRHERLHARQAGAHLSGDALHPWHDLRSSSSRHRSACLSKPVARRSVLVAGGRHQRAAPRQPHWSDGAREAAPGLVRPCAAHPPKAAPADAPRASRPPERLQPAEPGRLNVRSRRLTHSQSRLCSRCASCGTQRRETVARGRRREAACSEQSARGRRCLHATRVQPRLPPQRQPAGASAAQAAACARRAPAPTAWHGARGFARAAADAITRWL